MLPIVSLVTTGLLSLVFLVLWATNEEQDRAFQRICLTLILIELVFALALTWLAPGTEAASGSFAAVLLWPILALKTYAICYVGLVYSRKNATRQLAYYAYVTPAEYRSVSSFWALSRASLSAGFVITLLGIAGSTAAFYNMNVTLSQELPIDNADKATNSGFVYLVVVAAAFSEELIYRLGFQNLFSMLSKNPTRGMWIGIIGSSALWSIAHSGQLDPDWVKLLQIFLFGIGLGWLNSRFGVAICIVSHTSFNLALTFIAQNFDLVSA